MNELDPIEDLIDEGRLEDALEALGDIPADKRPPPQRGRLAAMILICLDAIDPEGAETVLDEAFTEPIDPSYVLAMGAQLSARGYFERAEAVIRDLCDLEPEGVHVAWVQLAELLNDADRPEEGLQATLAAEELDASYAPIFFEKGRALRDLGQLEEAAQAFAVYLEGAPGDRSAWIQSGLVLSDLESDEAANEAFAKAAELEGHPEDSAVLYYNWAILAGGLDDGGTLARCQGKLVALDPKGWRTLSVHAIAADRRDRTEQAWKFQVQAYDGCREADPDQLATVAGSALAYALDVESLDAAELVDRVYADQAFDEDVLAALREIAGEDASVMTEYTITLVGRLGDGWAYVRDLGVLGRDAENAKAVALAFETRGGGQSLEVHTMEEEEAAGVERPGVTWASPRDEVEEVSE